MTKLTKAEQELHMWIWADEDHFTVYSTYPRWTRVFRALAKKMGARELQHQGGTKFFLPATELGFTRKRRLRLSEAGEGPTPGTVAGHHRTRFHDRLRGARLRGIST